MADSKKQGSTEALEAYVKQEQQNREAMPEALRNFEEACNVIALIAPNSKLRDVAIKARGDMREANGEART